MCIVLLFEFWKLNGIEIAQVRKNLGRISAVDESQARKQETNKTSTSGTNQEDMDKPRSGKKVFLQEKIFIPVNEYPNVCSHLVTAKHRLA